METIEQILQEIEELSEEYRQKVRDGEIPNIELGEHMEKCEWWGKDKMCGEESEENCNNCKEQQEGYTELIREQLEQDREESYSELPDVKLDDIEEYPKVR